MKAPLDGGAAIPLATGQLIPWAIAVDPTSVYWANGDTNGGALMKVPLSGGVPPATLTPGANAFATAIAVDATNADWANGGAVMKVPLAGIVSSRPMQGVHPCLRIHFLICGPRGKRHERLLDRARQRRIRCRHGHGDDGALGWRDARYARLRTDSAFGHRRGLHERLLGDGR